ncbi:extracellular solute-binding protein [Leifsonia shinshuensis]|uniref:ABC transporter substrate-binding protein n=1 Tax=Leifsonia shinshuensis TaxID=150026 RepID=UPI001F513E2D|nr:extracellular solute-binding protein [Leifsonia shinshuensis]MCI0159389.1 extracellular solute-binding protein [Leifsonia shinshuensis]
MKKTLVAAVVAVTAVALAGCSSGPAESAVSTAAPTGTIQFQSWTPTQETFDQISSGFTKENPKAKVTGTLSPFEDYQTALQTQLRSGAGPDVFVVQPGAMLNQYRQYIEPVDAYEAAFDGAGWKSAYNAGPLTRSQVGGKTYGLPVGYGVAGFLWVNKTILKEHGIAVPKTYAELKAAAAKLHDAGIAPIAFGGKDTWQDIDYFLATAAAIDAKATYAALDGSGKWTDKSLVSAFEKWKALFADGLTQEGAAGAATYTDTYDLFTKGKAAFFANGSWNLDMYKNSLALISGYDIDAIPLPVDGVAGGAPVIGDVTGIVVVNKNSKNKSAAFQLARYMSRGAGAQTLTDAALDFPVTKDGPTPQGLPEQASTARASIESLIADHLAGYRQVPSASVNTALGDALVGVISSGLSPADAAKRVQEAADNS